MAMIENGHRDGKEVTQKYAQITTAGGKQSPSPGQFLESGIQSPRPATPIEDAPNLYPRIIALRTYERMMRNDAQVRATIQACKIPVLGGEWYVDPASENPIDQDAANFVDYNLNNMSVTFTEVLQQILRMFEFGSSVFEKVYAYGEWAPDGANRNTRNFIMLKKLGYRPPPTVGQYLYDANGGPNGIVHVAPRPQSTPAETLGTTVTSGTGTLTSDAFGVTGKNIQIFLPIEKLLIFTYDKLGGNLEGQSLLRTAYKHWYYKEQLYKIDAVAKERHGIGVPKINLPPGYTDADLTFAQELAQNMRTNERAYILEPPGWAVGFAEIIGNRPLDALGSALHHDLMIARNVLVQFIVSSTGGSQGTSASGGGGSSRGGGAAVSYDLFLKSLRHVANLVADVFNLYLIPQLVDYNFDVKRYPKLKVRRIGENRDLQMFSVALRNLVTSNIISVDKNTESWVRNEMDMPQDVDWTDDRLNQLLLKNQNIVNDPTNAQANSGASTQPATGAGTQTTPQTGGGTPGTPTTNGNSVGGAKT